MSEDQETQTSSSLKQWLEDNLRLIISILIVAALAVGIYSYSQRSQETELASLQEQGETQQEAEEGSSQELSATTEEETGEAMPESASSTKETSPSQGTSSPKDVDQEVRVEEGAIAVKAGSGDGLTHLARRALAEYLQKNPREDLTPAHKIYIEDYLRKKVGFHGRVYVGTEVSFSTSLIQEAINASLQLNDAQLKNLQKYVVLVPSLS